MEEEDTNLSQFLLVSKASSIYVKAKKVLLLFSCCFKKMLHAGLW